jgi:adenosylcobinamide-GDP ribazoletransferase
MTLLRSISMFTVVPVPTSGELAEGQGVSALLWLPAVGVGCGVLAALPLVAIRHWAPHAALLGAVMAVAVLAGLTRCLHLDGLADTADGLGSRAPAERALQIMRQSDIGPFGVVALVLVLGLDITALAALRGAVWVPVAALATAAATGRVAAVAAAMRGVPAARSSGFGTLVAGGVAPVAVIGWVLAVLAGGVGIAVVVDVPLAWFVVPQLIGLLVGYLVRWHTVRRLDGVTGDVFGALIELSTMITLIGMCLR